MDKPLSICIIGITIICLLLFMQLMRVDARVKLLETRAADYEQQTTDVFCNYDQMRQTQLVLLELYGTHEVK